jgi:small subunit ribosomal protein S16
MSVQIRLARHGSRKSPFYRIVVTDIRNPRDGRFIENLGTFNPGVEPPRVELDTTRLDYWQEQGAKPSATLSQIIKKHRASAATVES